jgi:hypothetical protein
MHKSIWQKKCAQWPFNAVFRLYIYTLAHFKCSVGKNRVSSLYEATENELQRTGPSKALISKWSPFLRLQCFSWSFSCWSSKILYVKKFKITSLSFVWCLLKLSTFWIKKVMMLNVLDTIHRGKTPRSYLKSTRQHIFWKFDLNLPNICFRLSNWPNGHRETQKYEFAKWIPRTNEAAGLIVLSPNSAQKYTFLECASLIRSRKNMN